MEKAGSDAMKRIFAVLLVSTVEIIALLPLLALSISLRYRNRHIDVGLGPQPLINNIYHKAALTRLGYTAETFVDHVYFITSDFDHIFNWNNRFLNKLRHIFCFAFVILRYKCLYIYFTGGPLGRSRLLWRLEAPLLNLAGIKVVVMPYGGDVHDMTRSPNLVFKHAYSREYRRAVLRRKLTAARIDYWCRHADHIISGCDWVHYMYVWDTLMLGHFSIDTEKWKPTRPPRTTGPFRILHAPNHREVKGTRFIVEAVEELRAGGCDIDLILLEGVGNEEVRARMEEVDIVVDQLIIGWYAMFALEGMAMEKPVLCFLREDLEELYINAGCVEPNEIPIVSCRPSTLKKTIENLYQSRREVAEIGSRSRAFVERHHSLTAVGMVFDGINRSIGVAPSVFGRTVADPRAGGKENPR